MNIEVPVCGPQAHLCPLCGAGAQCLADFDNLLCAQTRSCWGNSQRRGCPALLACALEHMRQPNACCLGRIQGRACLSRVGVGSGFQGVSWANQELVLVGAVCEGDSWEWYIPGVVHGFEWRRQHNTVDRRTGGDNWLRKHAAGTRRRAPISPSGSAVSRASTGSSGVAAATPGEANAGKRTGWKRLGKKRREQLRRRLARAKARSSAQPRRDGALLAADDASTTTASAANDEVEGEEQ